jgi:hypothetical protein
MSWYVSDGYTSHGPLSFADLRQRVSSGQLTRTSLVCRVGTEIWITADNVKELWLPPVRDNEARSTDALPQPSLRPRFDPEPAAGRTTDAGHKHETVWQKFPPIFLIPVLAIAGILAIALAKPMIQSIGEKERLDSEVVTMQAAVAEQVRKQLPQKVDDVTTLQDVTSIGPLLAYLYVIDMDLNPDEAAQLLDERRTDVISNVCVQKRKAVDLGGKYQYIYMTRSGLSVGDFSVAKPQCSAAGN